MLEEYQCIQADFAAGRISLEQKTAALTSLRGLDLQGRLWSCNASGYFMVYDGAQWVPAQPPEMPAYGAPPARPPVTPDAGRSQSGYPVMPAQPSGALSGYPPPGAGFRGFSSGGKAPADPLQTWLRFASTPVLALLPGALCGGVWFLYTFLGLFKNEGIRGVDWLTPIILAGLPALLWAIARPLDHLMSPLQPLRRAIPKPMRLGIAVAIPLVISCGLTTLFSKGYGALHCTSVIGILTSFFLFREPER